MGVDISKLPRKYQEQIGEQLINETANRNSKLRATGQKPDRHNALVNQSQRKEIPVVATTSRPIVRYVVYRWRKLDSDNLRTSCKFLQDGLVQAGFIGGDSEKEIDSRPVEQIKCKKKEVRTIIEIEWPE